MDLADFEEFVTTRSARLLRVAYVLTRDHALAEDLLQTALVRSWSAWKRIRDDPEPYVRRVLINAYQTAGRRKWNGERPTALVPEPVGAAPQSTVDDRDEIWRALGRLPRQQRAVVVLRYYEDLSEAQIAAALSIAPGTVKRHAANALAALRADPSLIGGITVPAAPDGTERLTGVKERIHQRRRAKVGVAVAVTAVVVALILGYAVAPRWLSQSFDPANPKVGQFWRGHRIASVFGGEVADDPSTVFTPSRDSIRLTVACDWDSWQGEVVLTFDGVDYGGGFFCENGVEFFSVTHDISLSETSMRIGEPVTVRFRVDTKGAGPLPAGTRLRAAIMEPVPFDEYPFPDRPDELKPIKPPWTREPVAVLSANGARHVTVPVVPYETLAIAQTPGILTVYVNGEPRSQLSVWDYEAGIYVFTVRATPEQVTRYHQSGDKGITISVVAEHFTGDWYLVLYRD